MKKIQDKKFLKFVKNTIDDLIITLPSNNQVIIDLKNIYNSKELTIINVQVLYEIILNRKNNIELVKSFQDTQSYKLINKEHKYMELFINKYFNCEELSSDLLAISKKQ